MKWVAQLPYYKIQREIKDGEQRSFPCNRLMYLYKDRIVTRHREFPIKDILDMSYRSMGDTGGMFYLHTSKGVYAYLVECDPESFINTFKEQQMNKIERSDRP
ncbi:hypothetical protein [Paenibacillus odorifer]|uniref:Bacterial Pleckstrin homology domain-containing protein n=1 Tax=Paenibacillus odorifer TaxID=189426 RepID=A0A1R0XVA6_9BACL|nr:hypothetical protein [Paenibacillus odorifer]OMD39064.1 hypothetical protein BSK52_17555 [Paenibacillus odorifer]